jgi:hypothetical protein
MSTTGQTDELLARYGAALDEIYALRAILAAEALRVEADLGLKSFPKSRREHAEAWNRLLRQAARGSYGDAYGQLVRPKAYLRAVGAEDTLTRGSWEAERAAELRRLGEQR